MEELNIEKERREALDSGEKALYCLYAAGEELEKAGQWGVIDMLGGGMLSTYIKRSRMSKAQQYIEIAKSRVKEFAEELKDTGLTNLNADTDLFLSFADYAFDGILVDYLTQRKIHEAEAELKRVQEQIEMLIAELRIH